MKWHIYHTLCIKFKQNLDLSQTKHTLWTSKKNVIFVVFFGVCYFDVSVKPAALFTFLFLQVMITTFQTETKEAVFWNKASSQHKRKSTTTTLKQWNVGDEENHLVTVTASCWQSQAKYYKIVYIDPVWFNHRLRDKSTIHMSRFIIHQTDFWLVQSANTFWMLSICVESFTLICVDDEKSFMEICLWSNKSRIKSRRQTL